MHEVVGITCRVSDLSELERVLRPHPLETHLNLEIGVKDRHDRPPPHDAMDLVDLPQIIGMTCPLVETLNVIYHTNCSLWEFAEHLCGMFGLPLLSRYSFVWSGGTPGIRGFMGNYFTAIPQRDRAIRRMRALAAEELGAMLITLEGVKCVCREPHVECPDREACLTLETFFRMCASIELNVVKI